MKKISLATISFCHAILFVFIMTSCKKFATVDPPPNQIESIKIFSNDQTAISAITGLYSMIGLSPTNFINGGVTLYTAAAADEIYPTSPSTDMDPFVTNSISPLHPNLFTKLWRAAYNNNCIYSANSIIAALEKSATLTDSLKQQLIGESKFIRALAYFYLTNMFGEVPLATTPYFEVNSLLPRASTESIQHQIKEDLLYSFSALPVNYPTANRARINKYTAAAFLARVYLYEKDWINAALYSDMVIDCGLYTMNNSLSSVFSSTASSETIWQLVRDNNPTSDGATFLPASLTTRPNYALTTHLLAAFEPGDLRKAIWIAKNTVTGVDYYYPYKYKSRLGTQAIEYYIMFRLAEQYLIRSEARTYLGNTAAATSDLNIVRSRAGLLNTTANSEATLLPAILAERQREFFCEMGHRWFDLKRTGTADNILSVIKGSNWQPTDQLFPIPQTELDKNPFLVQNPGY